MPMSPEVILEFPHLVGTLLRVPICELDQAALQCERSNQRA